MPDDASEKDRQSFPLRSLRLLLPFFRQYTARLIGGISALLLVDFLQLWMPRIIKRAVDELGSGTATEPGLLRYAGLILLLAAGIAVCRFTWRYLVLGFSRLLERDLRDHLLSHLLTLDRMFYQRHTTGEIMALTTNDLAAVQLASGMGLIAFVDAVVMTLAALAFMAYIHPMLTVIAVLPMPVLVFSTRLLSGSMHRRFKRVQEQFETLTEFARSTLGNIRLIKAYTQEGPQTEQFGRMGEEYIRNNLKVAVVQGILSPFSGLIANSCLLLVLFFGGRLTIQGVITVGDFVAFFSYLFMLTWPMMALGWVANLFQRGATSLGRIDRILQEKSLLEDRAAGPARPPSAGHITLNHLSFVFPGQTTPAIDDASMTIKPGIVGVVGKSGAGKSILCNILARLYPVADGTFFLDGADVNTLPLAAVRGSIAYVPQDTTLFSDTIGFNISLGKENASMAEIEEVARAASVHEEIMALPEGYQTRVGERGVKLSGGQRQRIALARALLLDRPIIIIDDGLSAVDMETEQAIIRSMASYLQGRTCIVVSHRVAPLADAGEILVMDQGRIAARGNHAFLFANNPFYAKIYTYQTTVGGRQG
ncbi:MAG: ABC transporter ATP-binding protein/permease [Desulfobulbaceae bacterium]|nr:ABC transporter ATP-binding protein/permease [Desulfobulbaceae bacterium]